jgi:hypothetical protein
MSQYSTFTEPGLYWRVNGLSIYSARLYAHEANIEY